MKTNTNLLTEIQIKAIKDAITDSMRKSLSRSNLIYDPNFERSIEAVSDLVIKDTQKTLATKKEEVFNIKLLKSDKALRSVKKSDLNKIIKSEKEFKKQIKNNPIKNARK